MDSGNVSTPRSRHRFGDEQLLWDGDLGVHGKSQETEHLATGRADRRGTNQHVAINVDKRA
ncbi:MAG: hypothetical protein ACI8TP_003525 [Acidimicrobiales bacterium]|jgi:hypothetical protein